MSKEIKKYLLIVDSKFFSERNKKENIYRNIEIIIKCLIRYARVIEIEQVIDCASRSYHRTCGEKYDKILYLSSRKFEDYWKGNIENLKNDKLIDNQEDNVLWFSDFDLEIIKEKKVIDKLFTKNEKKTESYDLLIKNILEDINILKNKPNYLRMEMKLIVLHRLNVGISEILKLNIFSQDINKFIQILFNIFEEEISENNKLDKIIKNNIENKNHINILKMAILGSDFDDITIEDLFKNGQSTKDEIRKYFLKSSNIFSGWIFLNINSLSNLQNNNMPSLIKKEWIEDLEILEHWTKISPFEVDSWEIRTRSLWDNNKRSECSIVAGDGLKYHPNSSNLLRRRAHGHRENNEHSEAIDIEVKLLDRSELSKLDTIIYLTRSFYALKEYKKLLEFATLGLEIDPSNEELKNKIFISHRNLRI